MAAQVADRLDAPRESKREVVDSWAGAIGILKLPTPRWSSVWDTLSLMSLLECGRLSRELETEVQVTGPWRRVIIWGDSSV